MFDEWERRGGIGDKTQDTPQSSLSLPYYYTPTPTFVYIYQDQYSLFQRNDQSVFLGSIA